MKPSEKKAFKCNDCEKVFSRKFNLERHVMRHKNQHNCTVCGKVFYKVEELASHHQSRHTQLGRGVKRKSEENVPSAKRLKKNANYYYTLSKVKENKMPKFKTSKTLYKVLFKDLEVKGIPEILSALKTIFSSLLNDVTSFMKDKDLVRLVFKNPSLDFPIHLPFMIKDQLTVDRLLSEIERVIQSYEEFVLNEEMEIDLIHIVKPNGGVGKGCKFVYLKRFLREKRCILQIHNKDNLCAARAIVTAKAKIDKHHLWNNIRQGRGAQTRLAKNLHQQANVPLERCSIDEIRQFQTVLPDYQILVVSHDYFNALIYTDLHMCATTPVMLVETFMHHAKETGFFVPNAIVIFKERFALTCID